MTISPIALFVYNRPEHTFETISALLKNKLAKDSIIYIFSDASKDKSGDENVNTVRKYIKEITGFKKVNLIYREENYGLANSIINGVTSILNIYDRIIVLEDDLVTNKYFLEYMNAGLEFYKNNPSIGSISGFSLPVTPTLDYPHKVYLTHRHSSWGWGTYKRVWQAIDWNVEDYESFRSDRALRNAFNIAGTDMEYLLYLQMNGLINSWSIRFDYSCFKRNLYSIAPIHNMVINIGFDGTGTHCSLDNENLSGVLSSSCDDILFPEKLDFDYKIIQGTAFLFNLSHFKKFKLSAKIFLLRFTNFINNTL